MDILVIQDQLDLLVMFLELVILLHGYIGYTGYIGYISSTGPIQPDTLLSSNNLSDLNNIITARTNLDVYSIAQTNNAIALSSGLFIDIYSDSSTWTANAYNNNHNPSTTINVNDTTNPYTRTYDIKITNGQHLDYIQLKLS